MSKKLFMTSHFKTLYALKPDAVIGATSWEKKMKLERDGLNRTFFMVML